MEVWKLADDLAHRTYLATRAFPKAERYGITAQLRRTALSVPTNIVEGYARKGNRELMHYLNSSLGSFAETKYLLHFAQRLGFLDDGQYRDLSEGCSRLGQRLWRFYEAVGKEP